MELKKYQVKWLERTMKIFIDEKTGLYHDRGRNYEYGWEAIPNHWIDDAKKFKMPESCRFCECDLNMNEIEDATEECLCDHCYYELSGQLKGIENE